MSSVFEGFRLLAMRALCSAASLALLDVSTKPRLAVSARAGASAKASEAGGEACRRLQQLWFM